MVHKYITLYIKYYGLQICTLSMSLRIMLFDLKPLLKSETPTSRLNNTSS